MDSLLRQLEHCLQSEQKALVAGAADEVDRLRMEKSALLDALNTALIARAPAATTTRQRVEELARLNALNGALVAQRFARTKARTDALLGAAEAALYGAAGTLRPAAPARTAASA
jgi:flagellar biosynthesis/type III secretory pathway chaperone